MITCKKLIARLSSLAIALIIMLTNPLMNPYYVSAEQYYGIVGLGHYDDDEEIRPR